MLTKTRQGMNEGKKKKKLALNEQLNTNYVLILLVCFRIT